MKQILSECEKILLENARKKPRTNRKNPSKARKISHLIIEKVKKNKCKENVVSRN